MMISKVRITKALDNTYTTTNTNTIYEEIDKEKVKYYKVVVLQTIFTLELDQDEFNMTQYKPIRFRFFNNQVRGVLNARQTKIYVQKGDMQGFQLMSDNPIQLVDIIHLYWPFTLNVPASFDYDISIQAVY